MYLLGKGGKGRAREEVGESARGTRGGKQVGRWIGKGTSRKWRKRWTYLQRTWRLIMEAGEQLGADIKFSELSE